MNASRDELLSSAKHLNLAARAFELLMVAKLVDDESQMTDGQLYFIIAKGIRYSGMPAFETDNNREQIWRFVLWVRRLTRLTPQEKADIAAEMKAQEQGNKAAPAAH